jgi:hypothetical protein
MPRRHVKQSNNFALLIPGRDHGQSLSVRVNQPFLFSAHTIPFIPKTKWRDGLAGSGGFYMRKSVFVLAVIGAACSSVAFAGEVKQIKTVPPVVKATTMSDAQMDKVTAGAAHNIFFNDEGIATGKETGSVVQGNPGALFGGNGAHNFIEHATNGH